MDEILGPPEWVLLEEEARAGTKSPLELTAEDILEHLQRAERNRAAVEAERLELLARYWELRAREGELDDRSAPDEVARALRISHTQCH